MSANSFPVNSYNSVSPTDTNGIWTNIISVNGSGSIDQIYFQYGSNGNSLGTHFDWTGKITIDGNPYSVGETNVNVSNNANYFIYLARHETYGGSNQYDTYFDENESIYFNSSLSIDIYTKWYTDGVYHVPVYVYYQYRTN